MGDKVDANEDKEKNEFLWGTGKQKQLYNETMDWDQALSKKAQVGVLLPCLPPPHIDCSVSDTTPERFFCYQKTKPMYFGGGL